MYPQDQIDLPPHISRAYTKKLDGTPCGAPIPTDMAGSTAAPEYGNSLRERVWRDANRAAQEIRRHDRLAELGVLLDKNPEVARILDLIDELKP